MEIVLEDVKKENLNEDGSYDVPPYITKIGKKAFYKCADLKAVRIHEGVASIDDYAFFECTGLIKVCIPKGTKSIGDSVFAGCKNLEKVALQMGALQYIGSAAFAGCTSLKSIKIPEGVIKIGDNAFHYCRNLKDVELPQSLQRIDHHAFTDCPSLKSIIIPQSCNIEVDDIIELAGMFFDKKCNVKFADEEKDEELKREKQKKVIEVIREGNEERKPRWKEMTLGEDYSFSDGGCGCDD